MIGPHGEKRPADVMANARHVARLATREAEEVYIDESKQAGGRKGGRARADALPPEVRQEIAQQGVAARKGGCVMSEHTERVENLERRDR